MNTNGVLEFYLAGTAFMLTIMNFLKWSGSAGLLLLIRAFVLLMTFLGYLLLARAFGLVG